MILTSVIFVGLRPRPCSFASAGLVIVFSAAVAWGGADVPPAGGLQALPQMRPEAVSLVNGGFEDGADGWRIGGGAAFGVSETGSRTGKACLGFDAGAPSRYTPSVRQALEGITPGVYVLRFRVKLSGIKPPQRGLGGVRVSIEYQLQGGTRARGAT